MCVLLALLSGHSLCGHSCCPWASFCSCGSQPQQAVGGRKQGSVTQTSAINFDFPLFVTYLHEVNPELFWMLHSLLVVALCCLDSIFLEHHPGAPSGLMFPPCFQFAKSSLVCWCHSTKCAVSVYSLILALGFYLFTNLPRWESKHLPCLWLVDAQLSKIQQT